MALVAKLVFVRHGESEWNKANLFCGWYDANLSESGIEDAKSVSAAVLVENKFHFDVAYTSALQRAQQSLKIILDQLSQQNIPIVRDWHLNERHYGSLTGYNKRQMADKYGEEQVQIWRRSFDVCPPPITAENPHYKSIRENPNFQCIPNLEFPNTESLKCVLQRVIPYWEKEILANIKNAKNVLVVAHGTVLRALIKHIEGVSDAKIATVNVPNSIPCVYKFDINTLKPIGKMEFLANEQFLQQQMEKTASIGK